MVRTLAPSACTASSVQDLIASPLTCTTQAPHWLVSQPTWVPVRPSCSRSSCTSSVRPSTVAEAGLPLTVRFTVVCIAPLPFSPDRRRGRGRVSRAAPAGSRPRYEGVRVMPRLVPPPRSGGGDHAKHGGWGIRYHPLRLA